MEIGQDSPEYLHYDNYTHNALTAAVSQSHTLNERLN